MTNSMVLVRTDAICAAGNQEMINSLLPVFESQEMKNVKAERDIYKMKVEIREPKRKADLLEAMEYARIHYVVEPPSLPMKIFLGGYGLLISAAIGLFEGMVEFANVLTGDD